MEGTALELLTTVASLLPFTVVSPTLPSFAQLVHMQANPPKLRDVNTIMLQPSLAQGTAVAESSSAEIHRFNAVVPSTVLMAERGFLDVTWSIPIRFERNT